MLPFETPNACIVGIDPGANGAIAFLDTQRWSLGVMRFPTIIVTVSGKDRKEPAVAALAGILRDVKPILVVSEKLHNMGEGSPASSHALFQMGKARGQIEGVTAALELPFESPTPSSWKGTMGLSSNKEHSRTRANALFPKCSKFWHFKNQHDLAEAAILALYGCLQIGLVPTRVIKPMLPSLGEALDGA